MSGSLTHPPEQIVQQLLVDLSLGTLFSAGGAWPVYRAQLPEDPDNVITVIGTTGVIQGRLHVTGEEQEFYGIQITVRGTTSSIGSTKARAIIDALSTSVLLDSVVISSTVYVVQAVTRRSGPIPLGNESPESKRKFFTINVIVSLRQSS